ncbi:hypothetical protein JCM10207_008868 [Rhodosporidiobolus poonsookiae]
MPTPQQDAAIDAVLAQARALHASLDPLYTWDELAALIATSQLSALSRQPEFEALYAQTFGPLVRETYGSMEAYLRGRLGWDAQAPAREGEGNEPYWTRRARTNVRRNDWPYGVPRDVSHWVVWVPLPLFHPSLCTPTPSAAPSRASTPLPPSSASGTSTPSGTTRVNPLASASLTAGGQAGKVAPTKGTWDHVSRMGLSGLTGQAERRWRERARAEGREDPGAAAEGEEVEGPEREIDAFVRARWREEDGWETLWFANPPYLQSVPGLAHFHVLARKTAE